MLTVEVLRTQYPVGHGGFHGGRIRVSANNDLALLTKNYVYDCGSESADAFDRALRKHQRVSEETTDLLFISHLDSDHVNKIDRLMGAQPARIVVLPYLEDEDLATLIAEEIDNGRLTASTREYLSDPVDWWLRRGAETIIFIEPGNGEEHSPSGTPPAPPGPDVPPAPEGGAQARLVFFAALPRAKSLKKNVSTLPPNLPLDIDRDLPPGGILAGCTSHFGLQWRKD